MKEIVQDICGGYEIHEDLIAIVNRKLPEEEDLMELADLFKIFSDSTRIKILYVLKKSEMCVCDIAMVLGMTQSAISHQLRVLRKSKLIKSRRVGKSMIYSLADSHVHTMLSQGMEHVLEP